MVNEYSKFLSDKITETSKGLSENLNPKLETIEFLLAFSKSVQVQSSEQIGDLVYNLN